MSLVPDNLARSTARAECITMNSDAFRSRASESKLDRISSLTEKRYVAPRFEATTGRDRSAGNASTSGESRRTERQWSS